MAFTEPAASILLVSGVSILLVVTGLRKQPGIGIIGTLLLIMLALWLRRNGLSALGFNPPDDWAATILTGLGLGVLIQLMAVALIEPLSDRITGSRHDHSVVASVKGSWLAFVQWMLIVWVVVAVLEEGIYRGFLMVEFARIAGHSPVALVSNAFFTSAVFGLSHGYQGRSGMLSTGIIGIFLAAIFILSDFNLWLAIFTHGFIDTVGIGLIAVDGDKIIRQMIWKSQN